MSKKNCNHCKALRQSAEASVTLEIRLNNALNHIKDMEHEKLDYIIKIKELEQQKAELMEFVSKLSEAKYFDDYKKLNKQIILILSKHKTKNT